MRTLFSVKINALTADRSRWVHPHLSLTADEYKDIPSDRANRSEYLQKLLKEQKPGLAVADGSITFRREDVVEIDTTLNFSLIPDGSAYLT